MIKDELHNNNKAVATWLFIGVGMLIIQVLLGGITRLTGSGLSITEWNVVTGMLPPMNERQWAAEFEKYRNTDQFR
jgi:cytochrome c oxidase assembly protein subunit 15